MSTKIRPSGPRRGFSLLELMIVLILMVGVLAIVWPNMQKPLRRTTLNEAAQTLREAIDEGRYEAITTGKPIFVQIQPGNHEVRTGSFANFANADDASSSLSSASSSVDANSDTLASSRSGFGADPKHETHALKKWRLPECVVVTEVNWLSDSDEESDSFGESEDARDTISSNHRTSSESMELAGMGSQADREAMLTESANNHSDWWLPISAIGQSRDASIVLYDTSLHESMTVTYEAATGALEIVR